MADEKRERDDISPDGTKPKKGGRPSNKPRSNRIMLVVATLAAGCLMFIIFSMMGGDSARNGAKRTTEGRTVAATDHGLTLRDQKPLVPPPDFIISDDGSIQPKEPEIELPSQMNDPVRSEQNIKIVMKEPSPEYQQKRSSMLTAMGSPTAIAFEQYDDVRSSVGAAEAAPLDQGGERPFDVRSIVSGLNGGGAPMGMMGSGDDNSTAMAHQDRMSSFVAGRQGASSIADEYNPSTRRAPLSRYELSAGTVISGVLTSGINSDLPGNILAQVSENIYDSATGAHLLIPQGTKVLGEYDSHVVYGQHRILVVWKRLIYPDGTSLNLGGLIGSDQAGYSGLKQKVDNHYSRMIGAALFASVFIAAGKIATENDKDKDGKESTAAETIMEQMSSLGARLAERNLNVAPTLRILPGYRFTIITTKDMAFSEPYYLP